MKPAPFACQPLTEQETQASEPTPSFFRLDSAPNYSPIRSQSVRASASNTSCKNSESQDRTRQGTQSMEHLPPYCPPPVYPYSEPLNHFVASLTHEIKSTQNIKKGSRTREARYIYNDEKKSGNIEQEVKRWAQVLPQEKRHEIDLEVWQSYKRSKTNTEAFSAFLHILRIGFFLEFKIPNFSWKKGFYNKKKAEFAETRLLPILVEIQNNPSIAERLFDMAEDGLGACHERPALAFIDIELEVLCSKALRALKHSPNNQDANTHYQRLIALEAQKLRKQLVLSQLISNFKTAEYGGIDPFENVLIAYGKIAKERKYFPTLPYTSASSFVSAEEQRACRQQAIRYIDNGTDSWWPKRLEQHLMKSDTWIHALCIQFHSLSQNLETLQKIRFARSEALIQDDTLFNEDYADNIREVGATYETDLSMLLNTPEIHQFTCENILRHLQNTLNQESQSFN
jgi:hypothetical protein